MRALALAASMLLLAGCSGRLAGLTLPAKPASPSCPAGSMRPVGGTRVAYGALAEHGAVAYRAPNGRTLERFGPTNVNDYPTVFGVLGERVDSGCKATWYRVQLPIKPNGSTGWVRAADVRLEPVRARIDVDLSARTLTLYRSGRVVLRATVAIGSSATPTPVGHYYVNQRLVPSDRSGPFGPAALGVSAYSNVLTGWAQGGPIGIHGTNEPWSIGRAVSNGCIRLPNRTLERVFALAPAGTPVTIHE